MANRPTILVTEPAYFKSVLKRLSKTGRVIAGSTSRGDLIRKIPRCDAAVIRVETVLDRKIIAAAKNLKLIASATTGIDHIDTETARRRGIRILHLHGTHTQPTAEHTMGLILSLARNIAAVQEPMRRGEWKRSNWIGTQLSGQTLGIVGIGRIGRAVGGMASSFGMKVIAYDPYVSQRQAGGVRMGARLSEIFRKSDIISIHAALTPKTRGMIGRSNFRLTKPGCKLVNTARGEIVNEKAILWALSTGRLAGAALDVFSEEPLPARHPLRIYARRHSNLVLTPHLGASTGQAVKMAADEIAAGVESFFRNFRTESRT